MGGLGSKTLAYYGPDGNLLTFKKNSRHDGKKEFQFVSSHDGTLVAGEECYLIHANWLDNWVAFVQSNTKLPGFISNHQLVNISGVEPNFIATMKKDIKVKVDFRPIKKVVWQYLFGLYGGGPVLVLFVPYEFTEKQYQNGTWVKHADFDALTNIIIPSANPQPYQEKPPPPTISEQINESNKDIAASSMLRDLGKSKMKQAGALTAEINQSTAETVAAHMARDLGKKKMEEANQKTAEINTANADLAASMFASDIAKKSLKEAKEKEAEQHKAAMEAAANLMGGAVSSQKLKAAKEAEEVAKREQARQLLAGMSRMGAKSRFKEAKKNGFKDVALDAAACMLQCAWRGKLAQRKMAQQRIQKQNLLEEGYARKLQSAYRARLAKKKVQALKAEKQRLREYGYARKLQGAWRAKKARARVAALKAERERLREEGCALIVQSSWRIRQARKKVAALKAERQRLREEGAALMLQSSWRCKRARRKVGTMKAERERERLEKLAAEERERERLRIEQEKREHGASSVLSKIFKRFRARSALRKVVAQSPQMFSVRLIRADNLSAADITGTSDPYVMVAGVHNSAGGTNSKTSSLYKSAYKARTLHPVWDEEALVCHVRGEDSIILTVVDHDMVGNHDFLGQVEIPLRYHLELFSGKPALLTLPLKGYSTTIHDENGKPVKIDSTDAPGAGTIQVLVKLISSFVSHMGPIMKQASSVMGFMKRAGEGGYKRRLLLLTDQFLMYFDDEFSLESPRNTFLAVDIESIAETAEKGGHRVINVVAHNSKESWQLTWVDGESEVNKQLWMRKMLRFVESGNMVGAVRSTSTTPAKKGRRTSVFGF